MSDGILSMSDEDFLKLEEPPASPEGSSETQETQQTDEERDAAAIAEQAAAAEMQTPPTEGEAEVPAAAVEEEVETPSTKETSNGGTVAPKEGEQTDQTQKSTVVEPPADQTGKAKPGADTSKKDDSSSGSKTEGQVETPDYEGFYKQIMAPLKANGKTINLQSPQEAIQLMQMGANYTRKMQDMAPHRKVLMMLENNGLLDEGKLSFLIDIEKKNPEAIKKLIKDAGLDPREIDLDDPQAKPYLEGNHRVTDEEAGFRTILDELSSNPEGKATLQAITLWDQASKEVLWKQPDVMQLIHQQRESGIYDRINTELERQRALGQIPPNVPFLHAYKAIGDQMAEAGGFDDLVKPAPQLKQQQEQKAPVATTVAKPKPAVKNGDKANAASPTRTTSANGSKTVINPLALSDDEFMKQVTEWQGRL